MNSSGEFLALRYNALCSLRHRRGVAGGIHAVCREELGLAGQVDGSCAKTYIMDIMPGVHTVSVLRKEEELRLEPKAYLSVCGK